MSASPIRAESPLEDSMDRKMTNERPEAEEAPAKRMRTDARVEDKARGKRLFGNLLGTLQKFKNEEKTTRGSEAAKRREQVSERIASKIQKESTLHHDIQESEKELKTLRISTESAEFVLRNKDIALTARHSALKPTSRFLHTSKPLPAPSIFVGNLLNPSPIPLNQGPSRAAPHPNELKPLYFLPKVLLPEQETELNSQIANLDEMITDEVAAMVKEKEETTKQVKENKARIEELASKLSELRKEVKPLSIRGRGNKPDVDELGRTRREDTEVEDENREQGVQIRGEDGDVEVEY